MNFTQLERDERSPFKYTFYKNDLGFPNYYPVSNEISLSIIINIPKSSSIISQFTLSYVHI